MAQQIAVPGLPPSPRETGPVNGAAARPSEIADLLDKVARLLREGSPERALIVLTRAWCNSPWMTNALGVCQLRLGNAAVAVEVFRGLVLAGGLFLRADVPAVFKTNYATALLAADNLAGCLRVLDEMRDEDNPAVRRLRESVRRWEKSLTFRQKVRWYFGGQPEHPLVLDFPPGDLE
jgi:hypothetical protein